MPGPSEEALGLTSPETDFLGRVWTLLESDATFAAKVKTKVKWDGSPHDLDDPAACELPRVEIRPTGSTESWESNVQHQVLFAWEIRVHVRGWDKANLYGLAHHIRGLLVDKDNFDALHTGESVVHEMQAGDVGVIGDAKSGYLSEIVMTLETTLRVSE